MELNKWNGEIMKEQYESEFKKIQRDIEDLWEIGKKSKTKEKRLTELSLILSGIDAETEQSKLRNRIYDLEKRLKMEGIDIGEK